MSTGSDMDESGPGGRGADALLAAEYVLGLLPEAERRAVEARAIIEPAMRGEVAFWEERCAELAEAEVVPVAPPPQIKTWTEAQIFGAKKKRVRPRGRWRAFLSGVVLGGGTVGLAAAAFLAVQSGLRLPVDVPSNLLPAPGPAYFAQVAANEADFVALVRTAGGGVAGLLELTLVRMEPPEGKVLELWLISGEEAPISLGVLPDGGRGAVPLGPALAEKLPGAILAISDEPPGGSPTGAPTGSVLATAALSEL